MTNTRLWEGVHRPTDVVGGVVTGGLYLLMLLAASSVASSSSWLERQGSS